jgi:hypothetical protein
MIITMEHTVTGKQMGVDGIEAAKRAEAHGWKEIARDGVPTLAAKEQTEPETAKSSGSAKK